MDIIRYNSLNEKLKLALEYNIKDEIKEYKNEMNKLLRGV